MIKPSIIVAAVVLLGATCAVAQKRAPDRPPPPIDHPYNPPAGSPGDSMGRLVASVQSTWNALAATMSFTTARVHVGRCAAERGHSRAMALRCSCGVSLGRVDALISSSLGRRSMT